MKLHPLIWVVVLISFLVPVVLAIIPKGQNSPPAERFSFLRLATLEKSYLPHYTTSLKFQRGNSFVYRLGLSPEEVGKEIESAEGWTKRDISRQGTMIFRHEDGYRAYVSKLDSLEHPESKTYLVIIDSIRRVGWVERQVARAWFRMASESN